MVPANRVPCVTRENRGEKPAAPSAETNEGSKPDTGSVKTNATCIGPPPAAAVGPTTRHRGAVASRKRDTVLDGDGFKFPCRSLAERAGIDADAEPSDFGKREKTKLRNDKQHRFQSYHQQ